MASLPPVGGIGSQNLSQNLSVLKLSSGSRLPQSKSQSPQKDPQGPSPLVPRHCYRLSLTTGPLDRLFLFLGPLFPESAT